MDETSAMFREQAMADLRISQLIPRHDLSGQALGISMFHAQQCIEKQLKAIMLRLNEAMAFEGDGRFLLGLSHGFYPKLHEIRRRFVERLGLPPASVLRLVGIDAAGRAFERNGRLISKIGTLWKRYAAPGHLIQECVWKQSLHVRLDPCELAVLDGFLSESVGDLLGTFGISDVGALLRGKIRNISGPPPPMRDVIGDERMTAMAYFNYEWVPHRQKILVFHDTHMARQDRMFSDVSLRRLGGLAREAQRMALKRLVAEFAFEGMSFYAYNYLMLYPHSTLGRYPRLLSCDRDSAGIYESSADSVLHCVYNVVRFDLEMLRERGSKLGELCALGHEHGYW